MIGTRAILRSHVALALLALAVAMRVLVPGGWMPAAGQGFAITLCSGTGMSSGWVDAEGRVHKQKPASEEQTAEKHCAFAGMAQAMPGGDAADGFAAPMAAVAEAPARPLTVAVGQGLAAPPPPSTGPPVLI